MCKLFFQIQRFHRCFIFDRDQKEFYIAKEKFYVILEQSCIVNRHEFKII